MDNRDLFSEYLDRITAKTRLDLKQVAERTGMEYSRLRNLKYKRAHPTEQEMDTLTNNWPDLNPEGTLNSLRDEEVKYLRRQLADYEKQIELLQKTVDQLLQEKSIRDKKNPG